jgi:hypothetical protein
MMSPRRAGELQMNEAALAHSALRDKTLAPRLQRALDKLVPAHLSEAAFWDNFFSHVDVIKVQIVTDYLTAQDTARAERMRKHEAWVQLFDAMEPEMRIDLRRAAERIAARQQPPPPSAVELQLGLDQHRSPCWRPDGEAWLEYVEDGPFEVLKVLKRTLERRGEYDALMGGTVPAKSANANGPPAVWRSPSGVPWGPMAAASKDDDNWKSPDETMKERTDALIKQLMSQESQESEEATATPSLPPPPPPPPPRSEAAMEHTV